MKRIYLIFMVALLAGCQTATEPVSNDIDCIGSNCEIVRYSMPNGNDLVLETSNHVIQIEAQPNVKYGYYVWAGDKPTTEAPDLVIEDGAAMVLVEE